MIASKYASIAAVAALAMSTAACSSLGINGPTGLNSGGFSKVAADLKAVNDAAASGPCNGWGNIDWTPPLPPSGGVHVICQFGNTALGAKGGGGGTFGGGGSTATIPLPLGGTVGDVTGVTGSATPGR